MENTINALIFVAGIVAAVYFANYTRTEASGKREQKSNDIFTFCMPCITALALLVSWTSEEKARQKSKRDHFEKAVKGIILIIDARIA